MGRRYKRRKKLQLSFIGCILIIIVGVLLGSVFTFGMHHWNASVHPEDAIAVRAAYTGYDVDYSSGRTGAIRRNIAQVFLHFADHDRLTIDGSCVNTALLDALAALPDGTMLDMLVHPSGSSVLSIETQGETLLAFEQSQRSLNFEKWGFFALGMIAYAWVGIAAYYLLARKYY
nr:hypothetical protein [Clostridia bacterium]